MSGRYTPKGGLHVASEVLAVLGRDFVARYVREHPGPWSCALCGCSVSAGEAELVVSLANLDGPVPVEAAVGLSVTHRRCMPSQVLEADAADLVGAGDDAQIVLLSRDHPRPRAFAVIGFALEVSAQLPDSADSVDLRAQDLLSQGFTLAIGELETADGPSVDDWQLSVEPARRTLVVASSTDLLFSGQVDVPPAWAQLAAADGQVVVVAGSRLGFGSTGATMDLAGVERAVREGRIVIGRVAYRG